MVRLHNRSQPRPATRNERSQWCICRKLERTSRYIRNTEYATSEHDNTKQESNYPRSASETYYRDNEMNEYEEEYDIVTATLQEKRDRLWKMTQQNMNSDMYNIMDQIRLEQIDQLDHAIASWKKSKE